MITLNITPSSQTFWSQLLAMEVCEVQNFAQDILQKAMQDHVYANPKMADINTYPPQTDDRELWSALNALSVYATECLRANFHSEVATYSFDIAERRLVDLYDRFFLDSVPFGAKIMWHPVFLDAFFKALPVLQQQHDMGLHYADPQNLYEDGLTAQVSLSELTTIFDYSHQLLPMPKSHWHPVLTHVQTGFGAALTDECLGAVNECAAPYFYFTEQSMDILGRVIMPHILIKQAQRVINQNVNLIGRRVDFETDTDVPTVQQYANAFVTAVQTQLFHAGLWGSMHWRYKKNYTYPSTVAEYAAVTDMILQKAAVNQMRKIEFRDQVLKSQFMAALVDLPLNCIVQQDGGVSIVFDCNQADHVQFFKTHIAQNPCIQDFLNDAITQAFRLGQQFLNHR